MFKKIKAYCDYELKMVETHGYNPHEAVTRCYGAIMFVINNLVDYDSEKKQIGDWWDNKMLPKFRELEMKGDK